MKDWQLQNFTFTFIATFYCIFVLLTTISDPLIISNLKIRNRNRCRHHRCFLLTPFFTDKRYSFPDAITTACIDLREPASGTGSGAESIILVHAGRRGNQQENQRRLLSRFLARSGPPDATTTGSFLNVAARDYAHRSVLTTTDSCFFHRRQII